MRTFNVHALLEIYLSLVVTPLVLAAFVLLVSGLKRDSFGACLAGCSNYVHGPSLRTYPLVADDRVDSYYNGALFLIYLMLLVWCGDIAAYYVGRTIGKHKLAPRVSPGKSWEGSIASVIGAVIVGFVLFRSITPIAEGFRSIHFLLRVPGEQPFRVAPVWFVALFAICVNVSAQLLHPVVESALKRGAGVKDSGTLLPGHGGVLDRIDALLFALPVGLIFYFAGMNRYFS